MLVFERRFRQHRQMQQHHRTNTNAALAASSVSGAFATTEARAPSSSGGGVGAIEDAIDANWTKLLGASETVDGLGERRAVAGVGTTVGIKIWIRANVGAGMGSVVGTGGIVGEAEALGCRVGGTLVGCWVRSALSSLLPSVVSGPVTTSANFCDDDDDNPSATTTTRTTTSPFVRLVMVTFSTLLTLSGC
jgi:hypothetical protein